MSAWTYSILENYCCFGWQSKKVIDITGEKEKKRTILNGTYVSEKERPVWCKTQNKTRVPSFKCFCYGKYGKRCPFFAFVEANKKEYVVLEKGMRKMWDKKCSTIKG